MPAVDVIGLVLLTVAASLAAGLWQAGRRLVRNWRQHGLTRHAQQVLITPPAQVDPHGAAAFWANLHALLTPARWRRLVYGTAHVALEYRWTGRQLQILLWVPGTVPATPVAAAARAAWPGATTTITPAAPPLTTPAGHTSQVDGGALILARPDWYPITTDHDTDPLRALLGAASGLHGTEQATVQALARPATPRQHTRLRAGATALATGRATTSGLPERLAALVAGLLTGLLSSGRTTTGTGTTTRITDGRRDPNASDAVAKSSQPLWEAAIRYAVAAHDRTEPKNDLGRPRRPSLRRRTGREPDVVARRLTTLAHAISSAFAVHTGPNRLRPVPIARPDRVLAERRLGRGFLLSTREVAVLAGLPTDLAVPGLDRARAKAAPAPISVPTGGRNTKILGRAQIGGHTVALPVADARHHLHVLGATGTGKSTLLAHLILGDIAARRAVVLIDPKGDLARDVLDRIPDDATERLVVIDPDQPARSATFNPIAKRDDADDDLIVDNIVSIFAAIFQRHWGPRIDDVMRVACLTVMRNPEPSLMTVPPLLNDKQFRAPFTADLTDPEGLKGFWEWFDTSPPGLRAQVIGPVLARLRAFLLRDFVRATIDSPTSSFDMAHLLDHGGILIARLPKGQLGEDTSRLLGSMIFANVWHAATARARQPEHRRRDAMVVIDEAHNILNLAGSTADMLAEARGYRLSLVLAHQHLGQLPRDVQLAVSANARNKIYFTCSPEDAHLLARHTLPELDEHDLAHLDAYTAAAKVVNNTHETAAFSLQTGPPPSA
ncbi:MAG: type IV secretion system DNA-binding domain-containing protein [Kineosporiaceae bacterium]|nr:type IV secretion system DNA-binding domain-containing protein [Kineosporiaceae bacterium]